ncbi:MAG: metalloregulator ArsR/SmtB family transcription factor [Calditerrivibrio sp.]|nr:metalloregulator ArsR/SmtB family transcription factor [Calditerrivibrio sp.]
MSDKTRLKILKILEHGELCVCELAHAFDTVQPKISFHLSILKEAGLVRDRKQGKWSYYSLRYDDMFKRVLLLSTIERIDDIDIAIERERLIKNLHKNDTKEMDRFC